MMSSDNSHPHNANLVRHAKRLFRDLHALFSRGRFSSDLTNAEKRALNLIGSEIFQESINSPKDQTDEEHVNRYTLRLALISDWANNSDLQKSAGMFSNSAPGQVAEQLLSILDSHVNRIVYMDVIGAYTTEYAAVDKLRRENEALQKQLEQVRNDLSEVKQEKKEATDQLMATTRAVASSIKDVNENVSGMHNAIRRLLIEAPKNAESQPNSAVNLGQFGLFSASDPKPELGQEERNKFMEIFGPLRKHVIEILAKAPLDNKRLALQKQILQQAYNGVFTDTSELVASCYPDLNLTDKNAKDEDTDPGISEASRFRRVFSMLTLAESNEGLLTADIELREKFENLYHAVLDRKSTQKV